MATQKKDSGGRIYTPKPADATYTGAARSIGFNPVQAASSEKAMRQYKAAVIADRQTISRELNRTQQAENLALQAQQQAESAGLKVKQVKDSGDLKYDQLVESNDLSLDQLKGRQVLDRIQQSEKDQMSADALKLQLDAKVENAARAAQSTAIQGLLSFAGSAISFAGKVQDFNEAQEKEKIQQQENKALNSAFFGDNFAETTPPPEVEQATASSNIVQTGVQAEATALGDSAAEIRSEGTPQAAYQAEKVISSSTWNQLSEVRGNVYEARMMYPGFLADAKANGLIRPGAQGVQDIQNLNRKFADATGLTQAALTDPGFVAENFSRFANSEALNTLRNIASEGAAELKQFREAKVSNNIAAGFAGLTPNSSTAELGKAWDVANRENVNGLYGGRMNQQSSYSTTKKVLKELGDSGRAAEITKLGRYAPNPDTPNLTLAKQFPDLFDAETLRARTEARTQHNLGKAELNLQAESIANSYWENPNPESLRQTEAALRSINTPEARRLADSLVQNGYNYDPSVAQDFARRRGTDQEAGVAEVQDAFSKGLISENEYKFAIKQAPDAQLQKSIDEAIDLYQPGKGIIENVAALDGGRAAEYNTRNASPAFKQELRMKEKRFNIELGRRLQTVLRDNKDLAPESQEFQDIVNKEAQYLRQQDRFKISYKAGEGYYFGTDSTLQSDYLEKITIQPGKQTLYGRSATDIFQTARISKAMIDPSVDQILPPEEIKQATQAILNGSPVSKRVNDWAAALGMSSKDFVNGQRLEQGLPSIDRLSVEIDQGTNSEFQKMSNVGGDIKNQQQGMRAFQQLGMPTRGAAYMSSAILHESGWNGTREWGEVAGDGTNRNGGLLSWASWAGNSARLGQIERYFGKNISEISEPEQMQYIMHELKNSYPESYAIFNNPNASSADLQWATWNYIKWDKRYTKTRWSVAESLIRWGTYNGAI